MIIVIKMVLMIPAIAIISILIFSCIHDHACDDQDSDTILVDIRKGRHMSYPHHFSGARRVLMASRL